MSETLQQAVEQIMARHAGDLRWARDESRTEDWRRREVAKVYVAMRAEVDEAQERIDRDRLDRTRSLTRRLFGVDGLSGDAASLAISHRDAADRVTGIDRSDELAQLLERAERSGDEVLARACVQRAHEAGWTDVGEAFLESRPQLEDNLNELWESGDGKQRSVEEVFREGAWIESVRPNELVGLSDVNIKTLASQDVQPAAAG